MATATQQCGKSAPSSAKGSAAAAPIPGGAKAVSKSRKQIAFAAAGVSVIALVAGALMFRSPPAHANLPATLPEALLALDRGDLKAAEEIVERIVKQPALQPEEEGGLAFVSGVVANRKAEQRQGTDRANQQLLALRSMELARERGFPAGREFDGLLLLGQRLHEAGQPEAAEQVLLEALNAKNARIPNTEQLLIDVYLAQSPPKREDALALCQKQAADITLSSEDRHRAVIQQAEIRFAEGDAAAARSLLEEIAKATPPSAEALLLEGKIRRAEAARQKADAAAATAAADSYRSAIDVLRQAVARGFDGRAAAEAMYLIGCCYRDVGEGRAAIDQFARVQSVDQESPESLAAGLDQAELLFHENRDAEAVAALSRAFAQCGPPETFKNRWYSLDQVRQRAIAALDRLRQAGKFELALELTTSFSPVFPRVRHCEFSAQTRRAWGERLLQQSEQLAGEAASAMRQQGFAQLRLAGREFGKLAELRFATREYPNDLWESAHCYLASRAYEKAVDMLQVYLAHEPTRLHFEVLLRLGQAQLALGQFGQASETLSQALQSDPRNPATFRARILASQAQWELGQGKAAETLLEQNLKDDLLTPESTEWRESLFAMGQLLHAQGRYAECIARLEEAVARYPQAAQAGESSYLIADSYRQLAAVMRQAVEKTVVESARLVETKEVHRLLAAAIVQFDQAITALAQNQDTRALSEAEKSLLRNCHFFKGAALFDMERYEEAISAYSTATNRYQNSPEVLDAFVQISDCYRRLNKPAEARGTIEQAKVVLNHLPATATFGQTSNTTRQEWSQYLDWLSTL